MYNTDHHYRCLTVVQYRRHPQVDVEAVPSRRCSAAVWTSSHHHWRQSSSLEAAAAAAVDEDVRCISSCRPPRPPSSTADSATVSEPAALMADKCLDSVAAVHWDHRAARALALRSLPGLAGDAEQPAPPWHAAAQRSKCIWHRRSLASDSNACDPSTPTRHRGCGNERTWVCVGSGLRW